MANSCEKALTIIIGHYPTPKLSSAILRPFVGQKQHHFCWLQWKEMPLVAPHIHLNWILEPRRRYFTIFHKSFIFVYTIVGDLVEVSCNCFYYILIWTEARLPFLYETLYIYRYAPTYVHCSLSVRNLPKNNTAKVSKVFRSSLLLFSYISETHTYHKVRLQGS